MLSSPHDWCVLRMIFMTGIIFENLIIIFAQLVQLFHIILYSKSADTIFPTHTSALEGGEKLALLPTYHWFLSLLKIIVIPFFTLSLIVFLNQFGFLSNISSKYLNILEEFHWTVSSYSQIRLSYARRIIDAFILEIVGLGGNVYRSGLSWRFKGRVPADA